MQSRHDGPQGGEVLEDATFLCGQGWAQRCVKMVVHRHLALLLSEQPPLPRVPPLKGQLCQHSLFQSNHTRHGLRHGVILPAPAFNMFCVVAGFQLPQ